MNFYTILPFLFISSKCSGLQDPSPVPDLVSNMTDIEKFTMLGGAFGLYVGNIKGVPRLNIPDILMADGPQGFRASLFLGSSTQWPCTLNIASSWDRDFALQFGSAMGQEFRDKGANVQLGPGICIARVPRNGRNFEYISGEDPYLGSALVKPIIEGIQSQGVMANAKHWVNNNQEINRNSVSVKVSERAQWEIYYPPFQAAVDAGVLSFMCSYNKIDGTWACENKKILDDLKYRIGFDGWVMSDWGATHSLEKAVNAGLDQEMGRAEYWKPNLLAQAVEQGTISMDIIDDKVTRMLTSMYKIGLLENKFQYGKIWNNVTSDAHNKLARKLCSTILLQNSGNILPLPTSIIKTKELVISVVGDAGSKHPITGGGGSGRVIPHYTISPLEGIQRAVENINTSYRIENYPSKINDEEIEIIIESDFIIYATGTSSHEAADREDLSLPTDDNNLIARLAERAGNKMIVCVVSPGAILMPWAADVMGILLQFFPGQEAGNALADVLFGHISPSGKLPLTMPHIENEVEFSQEAYPGIPADNPQNVTYEEELLVGYRWYHHNNVYPKFAFGFGLSYATFVVQELEVNHEYNCNDASDACEVEFKVARIDELGDKYTTASEIVQLYMDVSYIEKKERFLIKI